MVLELHPAPGTPLCALFGGFTARVVVELGCAWPCNASLHPWSGQPGAAGGLESPVRSRPCGVVLGPPWAMPA